VSRDLQKCDSNGRTVKCKLRNPDDPPPISCGPNCKFVLVCTMAPHMLCPSTPTDRLSTKGSVSYQSQFIKDDQSCQVETGASIQHNHQHTDYAQEDLSAMFIKDDQSCHNLRLAAKLQISSIRLDPAST
jgi:hypothetical protein